MNTFQTADQLGIPEDQRAALIKTLELMEAGKIIHVDEDHDHWCNQNDGFTGHFNMDVWRGKASCGTVACIGGTAELVGKVKFNELETTDGLEELFYRWGGGDPTVAQGAAALRNYLTWGRANWDQVMS